MAGHDDDHAVKQSMSAYSFGSGDFDGEKELSEQSAQEVEDMAVTAAKRGDVEAIRTMMLKNRRISNLADPKDRSTLHHAASSGSVELCRFLVTNGSDVNAVDVDGNPPVFYAIQNGRLDAAKFLIEAKADVSVCNNKGISALHLACHVGSSPLISLVLEQPGVKVNAVDGTRKSSLHVAAHRCTPETLQLLLSKGADSEVKDLHGNTPLDLAQKLGKDSNTELLRSARGTPAAAAAALPAGKTAKDGSGEQSAVKTTAE